MSSPRNTALAASLGALALLGMAPAHATTAITVTGGTVRNDYSGTLGYGFTASESEIVSSLGYDVTGTSLADFHTVDLYTSGGKLLDSVTLNPGSYSTGFNFVSIAPLTLGPGAYVLAANTGPEIASGPFGGTVADGFLDGAVATSAVTGITYTGGLYSSSGGNGGMVNFPTNPEPAQDFGNGHHPDGYFGPNFQVSPAPEPSQVGMLALLGLGLSGLILRARKRSAVAA